jgi:hypothetical protein
MIDFCGITSDYRRRKHADVKKIWMEKIGKKTKKERKRQKSRNSLLMKREMIDWFLASDEKHAS